MQQPASLMDANIQNNNQNNQFHEFRPSVGGYAILGSQCNTFNQISAPSVHNALSADAKRDLTLSDIDFPHDCPTPRFAKAKIEQASKILDKLVNVLDDVAALDIISRDEYLQMIEDHENACSSVELTAIKCRKLKLRYLPSTTNEAEVLRRQAIDLSRHIKKTSTNALRNDLKKSYRAPGQDAPTPPQPLSGSSSPVTSPSSSYCCKCYRDLNPRHCHSRYSALSSSADPTVLEGCPHNEAGVETQAICRFNSSTPVHAPSTSTGRSTSVQ
ncbi:hypothetical protein HGRIS_006689 [Hohenbuehelia grisea]|uniref:Uncharacterized protein n=1 Tax=Hohenbuehelia grisea TaxID=104357 RepID=A0ABR3J9R2_9AGAR